MFDEQRRTRIADELRKASNLKRLRGDTSTLLVDLGRLYEDVKAEVEEGRIPRPWAALCAYRLAHVRMWDGDPDFDEAEALFAEAGRAGSLGPWPKIYRLAAIHRAGGHAAQLGQAFRFAKEALEQWPSPSRERQDPRLQDDVFNLLELAAYFTGSDLDLIRGLGECAGGFTPDEEHDYRVVTTDPVSAKVACTLAFAREELDARSAAEPGALCFELTSSIGEARWKPPDREEWSSVDHRWLRLLALTAMGRAVDRESLRRGVHGEDGAPKQADDSLRQIRHRMQKMLGRDVWIDADSWPRRLALPVVGVVHARTIHEPPDLPAR